MDSTLTKENNRPETVFLTSPTEREVEEIISLYVEAGWWEPGADSAGMVKRLVEGSHCVAAAVSGGRIVGMARAISDGASDAYIQDVTVTRSRRREGIATRLLKAVTARLSRDGIGWVALIAEPGSESLYEGLGFSAMKGMVPMRLARAGGPEAK